MIQMPKQFFFKGGPQAVILLHAYASSSNDVRMLGRYLQRQGYTVLAPLFTGHATGEPEDILRQGSPDAWWQDTQAAIAELRNDGYRQISIFGLSLGGIFAMRALEVDPELLGGGSFSSPVVMGKSHHLTPEFLRLATLTYQAMKVSEEEMSAKLDWLRTNLPVQLDAVSKFASNVADQLDQIHQPVFVAQGGQDELIDASRVYDLKKQLVNSQVSFHYYQDAGHVITVNQAHKRLEEDLNAFLKIIY